MEKKTVPKQKCLKNKFAYCWATGWVTGRNCFSLWLLLEPILFVLGDMEKAKTTAASKIQISQKYLKYKIGS